MLTITELTLAAVKAAQEAAALAEDLRDDIPESLFRATFMASAAIWNVAEALEVTP